MEYILEHWVTRVITDVSFSMNRNSNRTDKGFCLSICINQVPTS